MQNSNPQSESSTREAALLQRGARWLEKLTRDAEAARAEALRLELETVLAEAQQGRAEPLANWIAQHEQSQLHLAATTIPASSNSTSKSRDTLVQTPIDSWELLLPHATRRLEERASRLRSQPDTGSIEAYSAIPSSGTPSSAAKQSTLLRFDSPHSGPRQHLNPAADSHRPHSTKSPQAKAATRPKLHSRQHRVDQASSADVQKVTNPQPAADQRKLAQLAKSFSNEQQEEKKQNHRRIIMLSGAGGIGASLLAHILLLVVLAIITLKLPSPPASLAFDAAASTTPEEAIEITQPLDAAAPEDVAEPSSAVEPAFDVSDQLSDVSTSMSDALGEMAPAADSLSSSAMAASAAAVATANPMNAAASFFGAAASGNCFCYVIDGSGSMRGGPWEAAKLELLKSLASLKPKQRFYIIFFNRELSAIPLPGEREPAPRALYATQENLEHARRWIDTLKIGIGAPPNDALELAISKEPDAVYLLTDGVTQVDVAKFLREENRVEDLINGEQVRVPIHTIAFYSLEGQALLQQIASENRGQFIYVPDPRKR